MVVDSFFFHGQKVSLVVVEEGGISKGSGVGKGPTVDG